MKSQAEKDAEWEEGFGRVQALSEELIGRHYGLLAYINRLEGVMKRIAAFDEGECPRFYLEIRMAGEVLKTRPPTLYNEDQAS